MSDAAEIEALEARLLSAMQASDVAALDTLIADDAAFTDQNGARLTKADDLAVHRSGHLTLDRLAPTDRLIRRLGDDTAIVHVTLHLAGRFADEPIAGTYAYTRLWRRTADAWRVEAAHCSAVSGA